MFELWYIPIGNTLGSPKYSFKVFSHDFCKEPEQMQKDISKFRLFPLLFLNLFLRVLLSPQWWFCNTQAIESCISSELQVCMSDGFKDKLDRISIYWSQCVLEISFYRINKDYSHTKDYDNSLSLRGRFHSWASCSLKSLLLCLYSVQSSLTCSGSGSCPWSEGWFQNCHWYIFFFFPVLEVMYVPWEFVSFIMYGFPYTLRI